LTPPPGDFITGYIEPPPPFSVQNWPEFIRPCIPPLPAGECVWLLTMQMLIFSTDCWCFGVRPVDNPSIPGHMAYADGANPMNFIPMTPCTGSHGELGVMACLNCEWCPPGGPISTENVTWGAVKTLYGQ
ncbi:MAG: hypothetical protein ABIF77_02925, partial [bacterium]